MNKKHPLTGHRMFAYTTMTRFNRHLIRLAAFFILAIGAAFIANLALSAAGIKSPFKSSPNTTKLTKAAAPRLPAAIQAGPTLLTEKTGYLAGETVTITGTGFAPNESLTLQVRHTIGRTESGMGHQTRSLNASADGSLATTWSINPNDIVSHGFTAFIKGASGATTQTSFNRIATVRTHKNDYQPGETALISGSGFKPGETVTLQVTHMNGHSCGAGHEPFDTTSNASGNINAPWHVHPDDSEGSMFLLTADGGTSGLRALAIFTDAIITVIDDGGEDDETGQKDLNSLTIDDGGLPATLGVSWNWDNTGSPGGNTLDACTLFDTNGNGMANFALCVTAQNNPSVKQVTRLFSCNDSATDRCSGHSLLKDDDAGTVTPALTSMCAVTVGVNNDPFRLSPTHSASDCAVASTCDDHDTVAACTAALSDLGSPGTLLNVCTTPSGQPNSAPDDCIFVPNSGFLTIVKSASPNDGTAFTFNTNRPTPPAPPSSFTINGSGSASLISFPAGTTYSVAEVVPAGWSLASAVCTLSNGSSTGTLSSSTISGITIQSGLTTTCTFTNNKQCAIVLSETHTNVGCFGASTGAINLSVAGAVPPVTYLWNDGATTEDRTGLAAGTYTVAVTDAVCTRNLSVTITQPAAALATTETHTNVLCFGNSTGAINLSVTGGTTAYTYLWNDGATTEDRTGLAAGTYSVTVTDANGCTTNRSITITQPAAALATTETHTNVLCFGNSTGAINLSVTGGTAAYTYLWNDGVTTEDRTGLAAGTYSVTVTDANGCTTTRSVTITQPAAALATTETHTNVLCFGNSTGAIDLTVTGGTAPYTFLWNDAATTEDRTGLAAGTYSVTVTDANGCTTNRSITITQPAAALATTETHTNVLCFGNSTGAINLSVTGGTTAYTYLWNDGATTEDRTGLAAGTYSVTVTDANGCTTNRSITITQPAAALSATETHTNVTCAGGNNGAIDVTVTGGTAPYTYLWNPGGQTTQDLSGLMAGTYVLTVTDANGCTTTVSATLTADANPAAFTVTGGGAYCENGTGVAVGLSGSETGVNYQLVRDGITNVGAAVPGTGAALNFGNQLIAGTYTVKATNATTGCMTSMTGNAVVTVSNLATVDAGPAQTICSTGTVTLAGVIGGSATSATWSGGTGTFNPNNTTLNAVYTPSPTEITAGTVTLTLTTNDPAGPCGAVSDTVTITINRAATVDAGPSQTIVACGAPVQLAGSIGGGAASATWTTSGTGTFSPNATTLNAIYTPSPADIMAGMVTLTLTTNDPTGPCPAVSDTLTVTFACQTDLAVQKNGPASVMANGIVIYTIRVSNAGPSGANGAAVNDTFPAGLTGVTWICDAETGGANCGVAAGAGNINTTIMTLPVGGSVTFTVIGTAPASGTFVNTATVATPPGVTDPNLANNTSTVTTAVGFVPTTADLAVVKSGPSTVAPLGTVTYTIVATNSGPGAANGAVFTDTVPLTGVTWTCGNETAGASCGTTNGVGNINTTIATFPAGASVTFTVTGTAPAAGNLVNTATIATPVGVTDPNLANNSSTVTTAVQAPRATADLYAIKTGPATVGPNGTVVYTVIVGNSGPAGVANAQFTDNVPSVLSSVTWTCGSPTGGASCGVANGSGNTISTVVANLPAGSTVTFTITGTAPGSGSFVNSATITPPDGTTDPDPTDNIGGPVITNIICPPITVGPPVLPGAAPGVFYSQMITAAPVGGNYTFTVSGGALPPGLTLASNGLLSGTPTTTGSFNFTVMATGFGGGCAGSQTYSNFAVACPTVTVIAPPPVTAGAFYSHQLTATPAGGNYTFAVTAGALPSGLTLTPSGLLSGTVMAAGPYTFTITATGFGGRCGNSVQVDGSINFVLCPTITLSPPTLPNGTGGTAYNQTVTASPGGGNYTYTVSSGALPPGLSLNAATGAITGTPTTTGAFSFTIMATGFGVCSASKAYSITITCPTITISPATLPGGQIGVPYNQTLMAAPAVGTYTWMVTVGALPAGLTLNASTGVISGTPTGNGSFSFTVKATGVGTCTGTRQLVITIGCATITFSPTTLPDGIAGQYYTPVQITTTPPGTYTFSIMLGQLPPGYTLAANGPTAGTISGASNVPGYYCFTLKVTGANGCIGTVQYCIRIVCPTITVNPETLPNGNVNSPYSQTITGTPPTQPGVFYNFAVISGALPPGLTLNSSTGVLSGTPTTIGPFTFTIRITGFTICTATRSYTLTIAGACPTITPAALPTTGTVGVAYLGDLSGTQPAGSYSYSVTAGSLPPGLMLNGAVTGTPTTSGTFTFTLQALNAQGCTGTRSYTVTIVSSAAALAESADYNGDGKADPVLWSAASGTWRMLLSGNQQPQTAIWGTAGDIPLLGDYDGDGKSDLSIFRPSDATWYVKCGDGNLLVKQLGVSTDIPVPGDYDGDGKTDMAVWRGADGTWRIVRSSDQTLLTISWGTALSPYLDVPVMGDYDGDGKTDLAVFRRGTGQWLIKKSTNGQYLVKAWGLADDVPVPRDYDGDGKTDIAVWRGAATYWYISRSSDDTAQTVSWGTDQVPFSDVPSAHDYDGDGKSDITIWRSSDQTWYILASTTGAVRILPHGQSGDRPVWVR